MEGAVRKSRIEGAVRNDSENAGSSVRKTRNGRSSEGEEERKGQ
jgi:hypothetical protein